MGRNYLWHRRGDAANAVFAAAGYNFRRLLRWLSLLLRQLLAQLTFDFSSSQAEIDVLHGLLGSCVCEDVGVVDIRPSVTTIHVEQGYSARELERPAGETAS